jgi:hypothetical protein
MIGPDAKRKAEAHLTLAEGFIKRAVASSSGNK